MLGEEFLTGNRTFILEDVQFNFVMSRNKYFDERLCKLQYSINTRVQNQQTIHFLVFRNEGEVLNLDHLYQCGKKPGDNNCPNRICFFAWAQYFQQQACVMPNGFYGFY